MSGGEEKTEQPTEHRLLEARKRGNVAKSIDVVALSSWSIACLTLFFLMPFFLKKISVYCLSLYRLDHADLGAQVTTKALGMGLNLWFLLSIPVLLMSGLGAILGNLIQFGFLFSSHPIKPDIRKLNPVFGFRKLFSKDRMVELIKQVSKFGAIFLVIALTVGSHIRNIGLLFRPDLMTSLNVVADLIPTLFIRVTACFLVIAAFDFFWQRHSFLRSMRMSKEEVKKEFKQQEGDPLLKQERRRIQQEVIENLSSAKVEDAAVVITNPAHIAVALQYDGAGDFAPRVSAKGRGEGARAIIGEARRHAIPILRNVSLARDLQWLEINEEIPRAMYDSVAEVLVFVEELNHKKTITSWK